MSGIATIHQYSEGLIEIRSFTNGHPAQRFFKTPAEAESYARSLDGQADVYFGAATRLRERGSKADVQELPGLWADCDTAESVAALERFPLKPTIIVETSPGHGQAWWLFNEPLLIEGDSTIAQVEAVLRGIADRLNSDPSVAEVARIMRVPGSFNMKRGVPGRVLRGDGPRYELADFTDIGIILESKSRPSGDNGHGGNWVAEALKGVAEGQRNHTAARLAGYLIRKHPPDIALTLLEGFGQRCHPPMDEPEIQQVFDNIDKGVQRERVATRISGGSFESLRETIERYLLLADPDLIAVVAGAIVAHLFKSNPLWLLIVQPPSSAKTEILEGTMGIGIVHALSDLTANTFLSGFDKKKSVKPGTEPSLLPRLDGRILMMKDFGTVLSMHRDRRQEVLAQLREVFDGHFTKSWGNGKEIDWRGHVGFIGGCTPAIDQHYAVMAMLGERFTLYRAGAADRQKVGARALSNLRRGSTRKMRADIRAAFTGWYDALTVPSLEDIDCTDEQEQTINYLADLTALVRTGVARDGYTRNLLTRPEHEGPARLAQQFFLLAAGIAVAKGRQNVTDEEIDILRKVAISTMPGQRGDALKALLAAPPDAWQRTREVANAMHYPTSTAKEVLEDLVALRLIEQELPASHQDADDPGPRRDTRPYSWRLKDSTKDLIQDAGIDLQGHHGA